MNDQTPTNAAVTKRKMEPWKIRSISVLLILIFFIGITYISICAHSLYTDKQGEETYWADMQRTDQEAWAEVNRLSASATQVKVGTYVENIKEINIKSSYFRAVMLVWFTWEGDDGLDMANNFRFYKGLINKNELVKSYKVDNTNYQLVRCDVTITKEYWTTRFPLESHQLKFYLEPNYTVERVVLADDMGKSSLNSSLGISGYEVKRSLTNIFPMVYDSTHGDPAFTTPAVTTEHLTAIEINRGSWGLYLKCFIALIGTLTWALTVLFICTYHRVDPLSMLPAALFGTVTNIMVGANLLPDALQTGLLEYTNILGILCIMLVGFSVININRIRNKHENKEFAGFYGKIAFWSVLIIALGGNIILPVSAYIF